MNLEEAKELFKEIADLCGTIESIRLLELIDAILPDIENAESVEDVINTAEELQINLNDIDILYEEEDTMTEINDKIIMLFE